MKIGRERERRLRFLNQRSSTVRRHNIPHSGLIVHSLPANKINVQYEIISYNLYYLFFSFFLSMARKI